MPLHPTFNITPLRLFVKSHAIGIFIEPENDHNKIISKLGIDIFERDFTLNNFKNIINSKNVILASLLLKQDIMCGIGNYIKNECLYMTNLNRYIVNIPILSSPPSDQTNSDIQDFT